MFYRYHLAEETLSFEMSVRMNKDETKALLFANVQRIGTPHASPLPLVSLLPPPN